MQLDLIISIWNANGVTNHLNEIELFLKLNHVDIFLISETHLTSRSFFRVRGYDLIGSNHPDDKAHGGAAILIRSSIKYEISEPLHEKFLQAAGVKIKCNNIDVEIYAIYFPPRFSLKCEDFEKFFRKLGNRFIVGGDYNAKHPWWGSRLTNPKGKELYKCVVKNNYSTLSTGAPTYWPSDPRKTPDLLDFVVYNGISGTSFDIKSSDDLSSDHSPLIANYKTLPSLRSKNSKLLTNSSDIEVFQSWIETNLYLNTQIRNGEEIDQSIESFNRLIHEAAFRATPEHTTFVSNLKISTEIRNLIRQKRRLRRRWQKSRIPFHKTTFNRSVRNLNRCIKDAKNESVGNYLSKLHPAGDNDHNLWVATKYLKRPQKRNVPIKNWSGTWCRTDKSKAEAFKHFLEETFTPFSFCSSSDSDAITEYLDIACQMYKPIKPFRSKEVENEIKKLNRKKSPGYDNIDGKTLKSLPKRAIIYITILFNAILRLSYFPTQWKYAKIIMILKPNKPENEVSSYRPISLLPILSKLFEKLFQTRLQPIVESVRILPEHQFGFRQSHGTPEQCHRIIKKVRETLENKEYCSAVFLDVKQAFDRVWHDGLLYKLKQLLPAPFYLLLKSYLQERKFYVNINDEDSVFGAIRSGVPQGSVLGPILYTIFTSDMPSSNHVTIATYADDTAILASSKSRTEASDIVQRELYEIQNWLTKWNIKVNAEKSTHVTYSLRMGDCPNLLLNGVAIPTANSVKYLGIHIDRRLNWQTHIKAKRKQLNIKTKRLYWLLGPNSKLSLENKILIYKTILKPIWTFGIQLWGTASNSNIEILQKYQSKTLRSLVNAPWFMTNLNIHKDLNIPTVHEEIRKYSTNYLSRLSNHPNVLAITLLDDSDETKRLKRLHILDLPFRK